MEKTTAPSPLQDLTPSGELCLGVTSAPFPHHQLVVENRWGVGASIPTQWYEGAPPPPCWGWGWTLEA